MQGVDKYKNIKITGYYTPIIKAKKIKEGAFKYPLYNLPIKFKKKSFFPTRKEIYNNILGNNYIIAYTNSLLDNFIMEIQGSGFIDYGKGTRPVFLSYAGQNKWPYTSIGKILIDKGEIKKKNMSMHSIKEWTKKHTQKEVIKLLEENKSFIFFKPMKNTLVFGASQIPLIPNASVAVDNKIISPGNILLAEIPILDRFGKFKKKYEMRLLIALDVGGSIKGQHIDIYQGIGDKAGRSAGFYNHYGHVWILK